MAILKRLMNRLRPNKPHQNHILKGGVPNSYREDDFRGNQIPRAFAIPPGKHPWG